MPQKSRNVAATYASKSKDRRTKKRAELIAPVSTTISAVRTARDKENTPPLPARPVPAITGPVQRAPRYRSTTQIIATDYQYVIDDLKHILIVSGVLLAFIVILAFVLQ